MHVADPLPCRTPALAPPPSAVRECTADRAKFDKFDPRFTADNDKFDKFVR